VVSWDGIFNSYIIQNMRIYQIPLIKKSYGAQKDVEKEIRNIESQEVNAELL